MSKKVNETNNAVIEIKGKKYPCRPTMGALLRFKRETGKELTELSEDSLSGLCVYLFCCVASASAADGVPFDMELQEFADCLNPEEIASWAAQMPGQEAGSDGDTPEEKKR